VIVHVAGLSAPDGTDDPAVAAELCSALGA
jgi:hypothetical protein